MAIIKATLAREVDEQIIEYIYPKTSADIVVYDNENTVAEMIDRLDNTKVDKEYGKGLSTNDFTDEYKDKLDSIDGGSTTTLQNIINRINDIEAIINSSLNTTAGDAIINSISNINDTLDEES